MNGEEFIVDRIESNEVVIESSWGEIIVISQDLIDGIPVEGEVIVRQGDLFKIDKQATERRKERINNLMKGMWLE